MKSTCVRGVMTCGLMAVLTGSAAAQTPPDVPQRFDLALGGHVVKLEDPDEPSGGGGFTFSYRFGRAALVADASVTRRDGHNDWRPVAGLRVFLTDGQRAGWFVQAQTGPFVRSGNTGWTLMAGTGLDIRGDGAVGVRLQVDGLVDRRNRESILGARASVWVVVRP